MFGCVCGGAVEVGLMGLAVTGLSCVGTSLFNWFRRGSADDAPAQQPSESMNDEASRDESHHA
jgi:hypothetical protein